MTALTKLQRALLVMTLAGGSVGVALAASPRGDGIYQQELAVCGHNLQDRAACVREAGAARQAAQQGQLTGAPDYRQNALARCQLQPQGERQACADRVLGTGQTGVEGSVMGGGVIRETVTPIAMPASPPADSMPMPRPLAPAPRMPAPLR